MLAQCGGPECIVFAASGVLVERQSTHGGVVEAGAIAQEREYSIRRVSAARGVVRECIGTNGCVLAGGGVFSHRIGTNGRVKTAGGIVPERCGANSGEMSAGGVQVAHSKTNGQVEAGVVVPERLRPNGHVKIASGVVGQCEGTNRRVAKAGSIVSKRIGAHGGIVDPNRSVDVVQCVNAFSRVAAGIAAIRCWRRQERFRGW